MYNNTYRPRRTTTNRRPLTYTQLINRRNALRNRRAPLRRPRILPRRFPSRPRTFFNSNLPRFGSRQRPLNTDKSRPAVSTGRINKPKAIVKRDLMTPAGMAFLKCAFSPPDFTSTGVTGVPDGFRGRTLLKKHRLVQQMTLQSGYDMHLLLLPVPGTSYFSIVKTAGIPVQSFDTFLATPYSNNDSLFGTIANAANQVSNFRFLSNHIELINNTNDMSWTGSISCFKVPITVVRRVASTGIADTTTVLGLDGILATGVDMYNAPVKDGVYAAAYNSSEDFQFSPIRESMATIPIVFDSANDWGGLSSTTGIFGFDNSFDAVYIRITGITVNLPITIKTWACVEYKISPLSSLYDYSSFSPGADEIAMKLYREIILSLPIAVPVAMNANFWDRVLTIIRRMTAVGSLIPGPIGMVSAGMNTVAGGITEIINS